MGHRSLRNAILVLLAMWHCASGEKSHVLAIADAGVEQSEDAPFVTTDYQFLPGEYVWVSFHIAGYAVKLNEDKDTRAMSVEYSVEAQDANGVPLAEGVSGEINETLGSEDKNWTPSKSASFLVPSFVTAGQYRMHIVVKDLLAEDAASKDLPFSIRGPSITPSDGVAVENFRFLRKEGGTEALDLPAYAPGDTVFTDFDVTGFQLGEGNLYRVSYGVTVLRPDGKTFLDQPNAAELSDRSFYPAKYLPGTLEVITKKTSPRGRYLLLVTVRDLISGKNSVTQRSFTLE